MHSPHESHIEIIYRILCCLKFKLHKGILFQMIGNIELEVYNDADWFGRSCVQILLLGEVKTISSDYILDQS